MPEVVEEDEAARCLCSFYLVALEVRRLDGTCRVAAHGRTRYFFSSMMWMPFEPFTTWVTRRSAARLHKV